MTTTLNDLKNGESMCCEAPLYNDICSDCKEHSEAIKYNCEFCRDTGIIIKTEWAEPNESYDVEVRCVCTED